jgi:hypothetical protein
MLTKRQDAKGFRDVCGPGVKDDDSSIIAEDEGEALRGQETAQRGYNLWLSGTATKRPSSSVG